MKLLNYRGCKIITIASERIKTENDMKNFVEELTWRGMIHTMMPGTEEQLMKEPTSAYVGIDPTADSLHDKSKGKTIAIKAIVLPVYFTNL